MLEKEPAPQARIAPDLEMKIEDAERYALCVIGYHFTVAFITFVASLNKPQLKGFDTSAETCYEKLKRWNKGVAWTWFWALLAAASWALTYKLVGSSPVTIGWVLVPPICSIILSGIALIAWKANLPACCKPKGTEKLVAKAWKEPRKIALSLGIVGDLSVQIQYDTTGERQKAVKYHRYGAKELEEALVRVLEQHLKNHADGVKDAERNSEPKLRKKHRRNFGKVDKLGQALGFKGADWDMLNR